MIQTENTNKVIVDSFNVEFGYELISVLPYAYWHYINGTLESTKSGANSESLYYFSPKHEIYTENRSWDNMIKFRKSGLPNVYIHQSKLNTEKFLIPPFKEIYKNDIYKYDKPIICICNRYNREWNHEPINYFDLECLKHLFETLQDKYQIVYFATSIPEELQDSAHSIDLGDYEFAKQYPKVIIFQDLVKDSWNETMLKVFANCEKFITMNGGYSILACFFGGQNIIYSKPGEPETREIKTGSFWRWYPEFNNTQIKYVPTYTKLYEEINTLFMKELPTINIIVRTCKRPNYFKDCIASIQEQTYPNINVIVGVEEGDTETIAYAYLYPYRVVHYVKCNKEIKVPSEDKSYGVWFPYNRYLDELTQKVGSGWIMYLDDDDMLTDRTAIEKIVNSITSEDDLIYWRMKYKNLLIPSQKSWNIMLSGGAPTVCDVSGIAFMFHSKYKTEVEWGYWKRGDFRVANTLDALCTNKIYIDEALTGTQDVEHGGQLIDKKASYTLTAGIVYSGRLPKLLPKIISRIYEETQTLKQTNIVIINNSETELSNLPDTVKIISGEQIKDRSQLSTLLANNYNKITTDSNDEFIWLLEDDMLPESGCFKTMFDYLLALPTNKPSLVGAIYLSRHIPTRVVAGLYKDSPEWFYISDIKSKVLAVDFTGTGCCLFRKESVSEFKDSTSFGIKSHDWAFCEDIKNSGGDVYILPNALCRHYTTETEYLIYEPQKRKEPLKRVKNGSKQSFFDIMLPRHKVHK